MKIDYYEILGIEKGADKRQIKKAYLSLAKRYHPDVNGNNESFEEKFKQINEAYDTLINESKRFRYDYGIQQEDLYTTENTSAQEENRYSEERNKQREEIKEDLEQEKAKDKKSKKKWMPLMVAGYAAVMIGIVSFFVQRQSKLAASTYENAKINLEEMHLDQAMLDVKELTELDAHDQADIITAGIYVSKRQANRAIDYLEPNLHKFKEDNQLLSDAYYYLGRAYFLRRLENKATDYLEKSLEYSSNPNAVYFWLGKSLGDLKMDFAKAGDFYEKAINDDNYKERAVLEAGIAYQNNQQYELAKDMFMQLVNHPTYKKEVNYYLGWHYFLYKKDRDKACIFWETAAKQGNPEARYQYSRTCGRIGN
ncbi:DnaJ domain-containing protein [Flammeovirga sp. SubArs3]|uniref:tetratricopeptide repeat protein n=1 Tax=Flammeovirga sp. SubArs3 TaxID=2995316 RepID=UPI00248AADB5|nr:DnaJ domain-containing protein [Flammeovirga sp. SubArs3]